MRQTNNTAIVLRYANYRENDRMLTLFSPTRGRIEALSRGCRKPKSPLVAASELFSLGEYELYEKNGHMTVISAVLTETFYPLRLDYDRLAVGTYLLNLCELVVQPGANAQDLFMLLLHTLSRLTFSDQDWRPLLAGFLLHFSNCEGYRPALDACVHCGQVIPENEAAWFDPEEGGICCADCRTKATPGLSAAQRKWLGMAGRSGSASWVNTEDCHAPLGILRSYVEKRMDGPVRTASMLPKGEA